MQPDPLSAGTLPALVEAAAAAYGDREAIVDGDTRLRFAELAGHIDGFARAVVAAGVEPGDRVAIWAPNGWRWIVAALGAVRAGAVLIPLNTRYKGAEAAYILNRTKARLLVTVEGFLGNDYVGMLSTEDVPHLEQTVVLNRWDEFLAGGTRVTTEAAAARASTSDGGTSSPRARNASHPSNVTTVDSAGRSSPSSIAT